MIDDLTSHYSLDQRVAHAALRFVYGRMRTAAIMSIVTSLGFALALLPFFSKAHILGWVVAIQVTGIGRLCLWRWFMRSDPGVEQTRVWERRCLLMSVAAAATWSLGMVAMLPAHDHAQAALLAVALLGVTSVAATSLATNFPTSLCFVLVSLGPLIGALRAGPAHVEQVLGLMLLVCMGALIRTAWTTARATGKLMRAEIELGMAVRETRAAQESAERASLAKSRFLATMSHEVRTPLNGVHGLAELLEGTPLDSMQREHVRLLRRSAENLRDIVNDVLDFSKIEAEQMEISHIEFEPRQLVQDIMELWRDRARRSNLRLEQVVAEDLPQRVRGDPLRLRQIITNFIGNALKFTDKGLIELQVGLADENTAGATELTTLRIAVRDTGIGIAPEAAKRVFDAFTQVDASYARRFGGTGLGLAICRRLVDLMGGRIGVDSEPGVGSTFWFTVPVEMVPASDAVPEESISGILHSPPDTITVAAAPALRGRILIVEDNAINRVVCGAMLTRLGLEYATANEGRDGIAQGERGQFDLVLMDCQMPGIDGYEATRELRKRNALARNGQPLPILALTANAFDEDRERARESGMDAFLSKPLRLEELRDALARWLPSVSDRDDASSAAA